MKSTFIPHLNIPIKSKAFQRKNHVKRVIKRKNWKQKNRNIQKGKIKNTIYKKCVVLVVHYDILIETFLVMKVTKAAIKQTVVSINTAEAAPKGKLLALPNKL